MLNLVGRPLTGLFSPLAHRQVAAPLWLVVEKGAIALLGDGELALRLFSLLCALVTLPLFVALARRVLAGLAIPLAVGLFALGTPFVFYAAQVKPYSTDVAATLGVLVVALDARRHGLTGRRALGLALLGVLVVWVSLAAVLVLAGVGAGLALVALRERDARALRALAPVLGVWGGSAAAVLLIARGSLTGADMAYLQQFWAGAFMPIPPRDLRDAVWPVARLTNIFGGGGLRYPLPGVFMAVGVVGAWTLWRQQRAAALLLLAPVGVTLAAAAARLYPFASRLTLFLYPASLICVAAGAEFLRRLPGPRSRAVGAAVMALCAVLAVYALARYPPPYLPEHLKPILTTVTRERRPGDRVYVYYGGEKAFRYYAARYGFQDGEYVMGGCWRDNPRAYLRELDRFRGAPRVWVILTHAVGDLDEDVLIVGYLDQIGRRRLTLGGPHRARESRTAGAWGYLYDLSDPVRLAVASPDSYPVPAQPGAATRGAWSC